jgi:hypothetical protein
VIEITAGKNIYIYFDNFILLNTNLNFEIINEPLRLDIYGFGGVAIDKNYAGKAFQLSGRMWDVIKFNNLKNKGKNIWVYEPEDQVFAGVELETDPPRGIDIEQKNMVLRKYAYFKHIGPYNLTKQTGIAMTNELKKRGFETGLPYIEIYGHWTADESKSETELLMSLQ